MSVDYSIVSYHGEMNGSRCGYCKNTRSSNSHGMTSHVLTIHDYQDLIDRGWRRSGNYCYKPSNNTTCCPSYTIKCESLSFKLSKSNKKILKKVGKYLKDGLRDKEEEKRAENGESSEGGHRETEFLLSKDKEVKVISRKDLPVKEANPISETVTKSQVDNPGSTSKESESPEATSSGTKSPCKKAKQLRIERKQAKLALRGEQMDLAPKSQKCPEKSLEDFLNESNQPNAAHKLEVRLVTAKKGISDVAYHVYHKYQTEVHRDPPHKLSKQRFERFLGRSPLQVKLYLSSTKTFLQKFGQTEYKLYQKYQTSIHGETPESIDEFYQFLVHSPLQFDDVPGTNGQMKFGSFHQQYWLDGKLIAVGVIDILPSCVSSVYFFYDPDYSFLSLGTYGSLKEMAFVRELQKTIPNLKYYYMGFYIHSCPKMRYKAKLHPSLLLCPEIYSWHSIDEKLLKKLDESKYQRFNADPNAIEVKKFGRENLKLIPTYNGGKPVLLEELLRTQKSTPDLAMILEYASLVGSSCARRIILYLN